MPHQYSLAPPSSELPPTPIGRPEPTPIRTPRPSLRDAVRQRAPHPRVDPNRGLFATVDELDQGRDDERDDLVDMVYQALRRDACVTAYLRVRGVDFDTVWSLVRAAGARR